MKYVKYLVEVTKWPQWIVLISIPLNYYSDVWKFLDKIYGTISSSFISKLFKYIMFKINLNLIPISPDFKRNKVNIKNQRVAIKIIYFDTNFYN